jgi:DNA-binding LacI/PurR family transcriptional regulator
VALLFGKGLDLFADPIWAEAHGAILAALQSAGYEMSVSVLGEGFDRGRFLADIESRRRHGLIMTANVSPEIAERASAVVPVVAVRDCPGRAEVLWSTCDNAAAAETAVAHLASLGHRRIAYVGDMVSVAAGRERLEGLRRALERRGLALPEQLVSGDRPVEEGGRFHCPRGTPPYWVRKDLLDGPGRPTAAVCISLGHTDNLVALARSSGLKIPDDLSVVSMVDCPQYAGSDEPRITVVQTMTRGLGENAVRLLRKADVGLPEKRVLRAAPELRVRASTAPPREGS